MPVPRLLAGAEPNRWGKALDPSHFATLLEETRLGFAPGRPALLDADAEVKLELDLKNTPELLVRVYELDLPSADATRLEDLSPSLDLEGLVPHHSRSLRFPQQPLVLHRETIEFPELKGPGAWIVEFVAEGHACRALLRKGRLVPYLMRSETAQVLQVFNEKGDRQPATLSLGPSTFESNKEGSIIIPNSEIATTTRGIIRSGKLAQAIEVGSRSDALELGASIHLDREQLLADSRATARVQVQLTNHGHSLPLDLIENARLTLSAILSNGVTTEHVISDELELSPLFSVPFQVPADTISLTLKLAATVVPRHHADPVKLSSEETFSFNSLLEILFTHAHFTTTPDGHQLHTRGRNGEALPNRAIQFTLHHNHYDNSNPITVRLRSNEDGVVLLGKLDGIRRVEASHNNQTLATLWGSQIRPSVMLRANLRVAVGEKVSLPLDCPLTRENTSFTKLDLSGLPRSDNFEKLRVKDRQLLLPGLEPGTYLLSTLFNSTRIEVLEGRPAAGLFISEERIAPHQHPATPALVGSSLQDEQVVIQTAGSSPSTRIHLIGTRFVNPWSNANNLSPFTPPSPPSITPAFEPCSYLTERKLGDEMRYILERRSARTFPGAMLPRPGLLSQRWSKEDDSGFLESLGGGHGGLPSAMRRRGSQSDGGSDPFSGSGGHSAGGSPDFYDYLARSSELHYDLRPDQKGLVTIPLSEFKDCQLIQVTLTDQGTLQQQTLPLPSNPIPLRDRRLSRPLAPAKHHVGTRRAAVLTKGSVASIENVLDADWRAFTTLAEAHDFLYGASRSEHLRDFSFVLRWPELNEQDKLAHWSEHASHELNLFLARKDPGFFKKHVEPMLAEKREATFIDDYLLGRDLTPYLRPFGWNRLNAAEKALLARALPDARERIATELENRWQLEAPAPEQETVLFTQTLRSSELAMRDSLGMNRSLSLSAPSVGSSSGATYIVQKLRNIIIPVIDFKNTTVEEAIDFLRIRSIELDSFELDPSKKGVSFVIRKPRRSSTDSGLLDEGSNELIIKELRLRNVPVTEALDYICEATRLRWSVDEYAISIKPATETNEDLFTRTFNVAPDFLDRISEGAQRMTVVEALKQNGVVFPEDASASFFKSNATLLVRNTPTNLDLVEQIINAVASSPMEEEEGDMDPFASADGLLPSLDDSMDPFASADSGGQALLRRRASPKAYYARPSWSSQRDQTRLWLESNYYRHRGSSDETLIPLNGFWRDLAMWDGKGPFLSPHFNACTRSANEALMCLALLDLPFAAERPAVSIDGSSLRVKAMEPMLLFYKDTRETKKLAPDAPVLVRQTFHRLDDRFRTEAGRKIENTITGDFQTGVAYGASLVLTNPSGAGRRIDVLAQIPAGSIALAANPATLSETRELEPYGVLTFELAFYFPSPGDFALYPMHVAESDTILASAPARTLRANATPTEEDQSSWPVIARDGSSSDVLARLRSTNLHSIDLQLIRWRLQDRDFFMQATTILRDRLSLTQPIAVYGFRHADPATISTWLENSHLITKLGPVLHSPLLTLDPVEHLGWQSLEFDPLVNPRAHRLADHPRLTQQAALAHYTQFLEQLAWKASLSANDHLHLCWFLFLQDRTGEAIDRFTRINPEKLGSRLAYDYLHALVLFHQAKPTQAKAIAQAQRELPAGPWRQRFETVITQADEIAALAKPQPEPQSDSEKTAPTLEISLAADGRLRLTHQGLKHAELKLYQVDLEMLFSKNPFLQDAGELPATRPNLSETVKLSGSETTVELPEDFRRGNILISADTGSAKTLRILDSQAIELRHHKLDHSLQVVDASTGLPLPAAYVKVYTEEDGEPVFHKDGYTDLRGKFDYLSLSNGTPAGSPRFALFVSHPKKGSRTLTIE